MNIKKYAKISIRPLFFSLLFWLPLIIFLKIAGEIIEKEPLPFDTKILEFLHSYASKGLDSLFIAITNIGGITGVIVASVVLILYFVRKNQKRNALLLAIGVAGSSVTNLILKAMFHRDRPSLWHQAITETDFSFPSGHAMASAALVACLVCIFWNTKYKWLVATIGAVTVFLIGLSRLYLGVHYPSDILAGWCVSILWVIASYYIVKYVADRSKTK